MFVPQAALKRTAKIGIDFLASFQTQPTYPHINCSKKKKSQFPPEQLHTKVTLNDMSEHLNIVCLESANMFTLMTCL